MLAVFCLRLALGMLFSLAFLSPRLMHPRFFRTHFVTALGLCVVAALTGCDSRVYEAVGSGSGEDGLAIVNMSPEMPRDPTPFLLINVVLTFVGSLVWIFERPTGGRLLQAAAIISIVLTLHQMDIRHMVISGSYGERLVTIPWYVPLVTESSSAALLGFAVTAMLVGHSYLIAPGLTIRPLMGQIAGLGVALLARMAVAGAALWFWTGDDDITNLNDINVLWLPVRWLVGFVGPLVFGWMAYRTAKIRSTQSATGILYVVVILTFLGELFGLLLTRNTGLPL
jgi:hypothetical protein